MVDCVSPMTFFKYRQKSRMNSSVSSPTGLHMADVDKLIDVLQRLADTGNSIVVIEHNLDVIKSCDYIIDLGPEGGDNGGTIVATGTPKEVSTVEKSYTGQFLKKYFE